MHIGSSCDDVDPIIKEKLSRSSSSSSFSSSFDPLLDSDNAEKEVLDNFITKSRQDSPSSPRAVVVTSPEVFTQWNMITASPRSVAGSLLSPEHSPLTPEWSTVGVSPNQSPPTQMMGRIGVVPAGYDPNRIPSSIFNSKPTTPMDWSSASNESLFSIHMGNNSFSTDHAIILGKSGELTKPDELSSFTSSHQHDTETKSNELNNSPSSLATVIEVAAENYRKNASMGEDSGVKEVVNETPKVVTKETAEDHSKESIPASEGLHFSTIASNVSDGRGMPPADGARISASNPRLSDESGNSSSSFAFPVLTGEGGISGLVKVAPDSLQSKPPVKPHSQSQPQAREGTRKASETRWFYCFSCFSCRALCCY